MKTILITCIIFLLLGILWLTGHSEWHLNRNQHNQLPKGKLVHQQGDLYLDEAQQTWVLQPSIKNKFHQPNEAIIAPSTPYPNLDAIIDYDPNNPNLKFLCETDKGGSFEAILQPNGEYLTSGPKLGTYNYGHPSGLWGSIKHVFLDVLPHFVSGDYH